MFIFQTEITCGTSYTLSVPTPTRSLRPVTYVWVNASLGRSSHLRIFSAQMTQQIALKELGTRVKILTVAPATHTDKFAGARPSLLVRDWVGCTPLQVAHRFGATGTVPVLEKAEARERSELVTV